MAVVSRRSLLAGAAGLTLGGAGASALAVPASARSARRRDRIASVAYIEVNDNSLENVGRYVLDDGSPAVDIAIIFAANINHDGEHAYLHCNENVQHVLDDAETIIRPLQRQGIKVLLSLLGNHQGAGFANFPDRRAADRFAQQAATVVRRYGLDGVDLDDEWVQYGENGTGMPNEHSFVHFVEALRRKMRDKLLTFYVIGPSAERQEHRGTRVGDLVDHAWNPYYGSFRYYDVPGLPRSRYGAAAVDLGSAATTPELVHGLAERTVAEGCGAFVTYQLQGGDQTELVSAFTQPLYGSPAHLR